MSSRRTALSFIQVHPQTNAFTVNPEAVKMLSSIKGKVSVVVVSGPYRSGKSTLLNMLVDARTNGKTSKSQDIGFATGGTTVAVTKGLWIWSQPVQHPGAENTSIIYVDSEGLGSVDSDRSFDVQIFTLSMLLSSLFVLNITSRIDEPTIEQLNLVVQMTKSIKIDNQQRAENVRLEQLADQFPTFMIVIRDFALRPVDPDTKQPLTSTEYLEQCLQSKPGSRHEANNGIRNALKTVFPQRDCVTLVLPVADENLQQDISALDDRQLRPEFVAGVNKLKQRVLQMGKPKSVNGQYVNGAMLASLAQTYCEAMNNGKVPTINDAWSNVVQLQGKSALIAAQQFVQQHLATLAQRSDVLDSEELQRALHSVLEQAHNQLIQNAALLESSIQQQLLAELDQFVHQASATIEKNNSLRSEQQCTQLLDQLWQQSQLEQQLTNRDNLYKLQPQQLTSTLDQLHTQYHQRAKGPSKATVYSTFIQQKQTLISNALLAALHTAQQQLQEYTQQLQALQKQVQQAQINDEKYKLSYENQQREIQRLQQQLNDGNTQMQQQRSQFEQQHNKLQDQYRELQMVSASNEAELKHAHQQHQSLQQQHQQHSTKAESSYQQLQQQYNSVNQQHNTLQQQLEAARQQYQALERKHQQLEQQRQGDADANTKRLKSEVKELQTQLRDRDQLAHQVQQLQHEHASVSADRSRYLSQISDLNQQLDTARDEINGLQQRATASSAAASTASQSQVRQLQTKVQDLTRERDELVKESSEYESQVADLHKQIKQLKNNLQSSKALHAAIEASSSDDGGNSDGEVEHAMDTANDDMPALEEEERPPIVSNGRASTTSNARTSVAPAQRKSLAREKAVDPNALTVNELKSWLTSLDVTFPVKQQTKAYYIDMLYEAEPELADMFPKVSGKATRAKKK